MSLQPELNYTVPDQTARIAKAAFPRGTLCIRIYDHLGTIFSDQDFVDIFPGRGQPAQAPFRLALITILQFLEDLSDRAAADAVRGRIDWKYLLCLELDDAGFDYSILSEFRARLLAGGIERRLLDKLLTNLRAQKLIKARGKQRTDSTHVLAAIRELNRLELIGETLRAALNALASVVPDWIRAHCPAEWVERYGRRVEDYRLPKGERARAEYATMIGVDGHHLLDAVYDPQSPGWLREIPALEILRRVWVEQFQIVGILVQLRDTDSVPPSSQLINSPYDAETRYGRKRDTTWIGYKVHITESCDEDSPHLITDVQTEPAPAQDQDAVDDIHKALAAQSLLPARHLVDAAYTKADQLANSSNQYEVELFGPVAPSSSWQARQASGFDNSQFEVDWQHEQIRCPAGRISSNWQPTTDKYEKEFILVSFRPSDCQNCASKAECTKGKARKIHLLPKPSYEALQMARTREQTTEFKQQYRLRAGVEGTISQGVRAFGLRRSRYWGEAKTHLQHLATGVAINFARLADWFTAYTPEKTRVSAFTRAVQPLPV